MEARCPGCGLLSPASEGPVHAYFNAGPACWALFGEVSARHYGDVSLAAAHQLTVDAYAVQHAGGPHPDKSVDVHLIGLHLVLEAGRSPGELPALYRTAIARAKDWPHLPPPDARGARTIADVATASPAEHIATVRAWAADVWSAWSEHHRSVRDLAERLISSRGP